MATAIVRAVWPSQSPPFLGLTRSFTRFAMASLASSVFTLSTSSSTTAMCSGVMPVFNRCDTVSRKAANGPWTSSDGSASRQGTSGRRASRPNASALSAMLAPRITTGKNHTEPTSSRKPSRCTPVTGTVNSDRMASHSAIADIRRE